MKKYLVTYTGFYDRKSHYSIVIEASSPKEAAALYRSRSYPGDAGVGMESYDATEEATVLVTPLYDISGERRTHTFTITPTGVTITEKVDISE